MWARICECALGIWLLMSPFIFDHPRNVVALWLNDFISGGVLIILSLASYWRPTAWAHWILIVVACWLAAFGRFWQSPPLSPALQNDILVGLLLLMFAIIPNNASQPPRSWQRRLDAG